MIRATGASNLTISQVDLNIILVLVVWELIWKGIALWKCGRNNQKTWYVFILILNTFGILEIAYLLFFQPKRRHHED